jgi:cell division protein FtsI (penicillin-binding protein 3)
VFHRIAQQVLEYLHTPHDLELPASRKLMMAAKQVHDDDLVEGSPDHVGDTVDVASGSLDEPDQVAVQPQAPPKDDLAVVPARLLQHVTTDDAPEPTGSPMSSAPIAAPQPAVDASHGTVVLGVDENAVVVPSFAGKSVRGAIELAEDAGLDLDVVGNGLAHDQSPAAGSRVLNGSKVTVRFAR